MLVEHQHLVAAESALTFRDVHRWLVKVGDDRAVDNEVRDICNVFALELEALLATTVVNSEISLRIWNAFRRLVVAVSMKAQ